MNLVVLPALYTKHLETVSHTLLSTLHAMREDYDAVLLCNAANAPFVRILQLGGAPVALNVDGLERKRRKWGLWEAHTMPSANDLQPYSRTPSSPMPRSSIATTAGITERRRR